MQRRLQQKVIAGLQNIFWIKKSLLNDKSIYLKAKMQKKNTRTQCVIVISIYLRAQ